MKYILPFLLLTFSLSAYAAEKKITQEKPWTDEYQYGEKEKTPDTKDIK